MSANSSGSGRTGGGSPPQETKPSTSETGEVTGGSVDNTCNNQTHSTTHRTRSPTIRNLTDESDTHSPEQAQSKDEIIMNDEKLADDKEKGEKNRITTGEQSENFKPGLREKNIQNVGTVSENTEGRFDDNAMQGAQDDNPSRNNDQDKHFHEDKGKVPIANPAAEQPVDQHKSSRNILTEEVSTDVVPSTLLTGKSNQGDDTATPPVTDSSHQGDDTATPPVTDSSHQGDDTSTPPVTDSSNQGDDTATPPVTDSSNQGDDTATPPVTDSSNQGDDTSTPPVIDSSNQGDDTATPPVVDSLNQDRDSTTTPEEDNSNQGDDSTKAILADILNQIAVKNANQAGHPDQRDGKTSELGSWDNADGGATDNTEKAENDGSSELQAGNLDKRKLSQSGNQMTDYAIGQVKEGVTQSEHPNVPFSSSQSQDDLTVIEYQLEQMFDEIFDESTLIENKEELKNNFKKKIKDFFLTKVEDGTLSWRSFHPNVTDNMPEQKFDSDINFAEIDMKDVRRRIRGQQGAEGEPSPYPYDEQCVKEPRFLSMRDPEKNQGHEMDKSNPTLAKPHVEKTSKAPNQPTGGPPFAKSCLPGISTTRRPINSSTSQTELDCKKNAEGVKTETLYSSAAGSSKRSSSEAPTAQTGMTFLTKAVEIGTRSLHSTTRSSNRLSFGDGNNSSIKARQGDMSEMKKEKSSELCPSTMLSHSQQSTDQTGPFNNKFFSEPVSPSTDSQQVETHPKAEEQKSVRNIRINIQRGSQYPSEFPLQCSFVEYFEWTYCLIKSPETLKNTLKKAGIDMHFLLNKPPVFRILQNQRDIAELIQRAFRETVKQINLAYHFFDWDMSRPEKDFESFCKNWNDIKDYPSVFLSWDKWCERVILCLVGEKTQVEIVKALVESELQMKFSIENKENAEFFTWRTPTKGKWARVLQASKDNLERDFPVKISYEPNSEIEISAKTKDVVKRVFERVKEISKCVQPLELPKEHMFLLHSEKAQLYIKTELKMQFGWILHFLPIEMDEPDILHVYEENNTELNNISLKIMKCLFLIPSTDKLCQIFTSDLGRRLSKNLAEHNEGKVQIVLDITNQPCCVGTKDLEEKMKVTLAKYVLNREIIKLPSEEVWRFCQKHSIFENIARELCCEVQLSDHQLTVEISGPAQSVSEVSREIEMKVKNITSKTIISMDISNESEITKLIMKWNAEKRCFVSVRNDKSKTSAPWKKWVQKKGMNINLVYSVNLNISQEVQEDEFKVVLKPEELDGARSKNPIEHIHGFPYHVHLLVPSSENGKFKDIVTTRFKDIIKFNKENWKKRSMIVDCDGVPVQELNISMKNMCHTLDTTNASDLCITKCEFCDKRFHVFDSMTRVIETHLKKKHYEVMEWKGRSIEMEVFSGQLAQQKGLDVIVNSASKSLDLKAGFVSRSILNAAGPGIQTELNNGYREGLNEGEIAVTKGYDLSCRFVFHGVLRGYSSWDNFRCLRKIIRTCLETADTLMMESIAFPALGTGNLGYSRRDVANVLFEEVEAYEKKVKIGSLNRVCCVIYEKDTLAIQEFTRIHSLWKQDHKVQNVQKQVMVTSDKADVIEEICQELKQIQHHKANMTEPPISEITDTMRLGKPSTTGVGMESNIMRKKVNGSSQLHDDLSEEKRCLLVKGREDFEKDVHAWEKRLRNDFINMAENIVCPFHHPNQALVQFPSENDVAEVFKDRNLNEKYMVLKFPSQAVVGLEAVVTPGMVQLLEQREVTISEIRSKSGVAVQQKDSNTMVLSGNILEIKAAFTFFSSLVKDAPSDGKEIKKTEKLPIEEKIPQDHLPRVSGKMGNDDDLVKQGQISEQVSDISSKEVIKSTPGNEHAGFDKSSVSTKGSSSKKKFNTSNVMQLKCTDEEVTKLKHFFRNLMINVDETRDPDQSHIYLLFLDKDTKIKVEESLQKIRDMPGSIIQLQKTFDGIEETLAKQSTEDAFCYLSKDRRQIELIGIDRGNLQRIKEKLTGLLYSERQIVKESCESQKDTVFVTNEGISVFVECTSILNIGKPVDAIVCPISKQCDIKSGLPRAIADLAGPAYVEELTDIFNKNEKMFPDEFVCAIPARDCKTCKYVINVTTKQWRKGETESKECELFLLKQMTQVLLKAEEMRIRSMAIPAICSGNCRYPKEVCALCYASAVLMYSRTIRESKEALHEIFFVDQSAEMITLIKSVFSHSNVEETTRMKERELLQNCSGSELYPYFSYEDGLFSLSENLKLRIFDSTDMKPNKSKRTLVYHKSLGDMEVAVKENWLPDYSKKKSGKDVFFCKQKSEISKIPDVIFPKLEYSVSETFSKNLSTFYVKILNEAERQSFYHIMLPFYGSVKGNADVSRNSAQCLINALHKLAAGLTSKTAFDIVMPIADKRTREIMRQEIEHYVESARAGFHHVCRTK